MARTNAKLGYLASSDLTPLPTPTDDIDQKTMTVARHCKTFHLATNYHSLKLITSNNIKKENRQIPAKAIAATVAMSQSRPTNRKSITTNSKSNSAKTSLPKATAPMKTDADSHMD